MTAKSRIELSNAISLKEIEKTQTTAKSEENQLMLPIEVLEDKQYFRIMEALEIIPDIRQI